MVTAEPLIPLPATSTDAERRSRYKILLERLKLLLEGESSFVAAMATVACEIHASLEYSNWTGFYQTDSLKSSELVVGPYQGSLACLRIPFSRGVCGAAAREKQTQLVDDVHAFPGHIACASTTQSEIVVPLIHIPPVNVLAVLDLDSNRPAAFKIADAEGLEMICRWMAETWGGLDSN